MKFINNFSAKLVDVFDGQTLPLTADDLARLPARNIYKLTILSPGVDGHEIVHCEGDYCERGMEGTVKRDWPAGSVAYMAITADDANRWNTPAFYGTSYETADVGATVDDLNSSATIVTAGHGDSVVAITYETDSYSGADNIVPEGTVSVSANGGMGWSILGDIKSMFSIKQTVNRFHINSVSANDNYIVMGVTIYDTAPIDPDVFESPSIGYKNLILISSDGGFNWTGNEVFYNEHSWDGVLVAVGGSDIYISMCSGGLIKKTTDGGASFSEKSFSALIGKSGSVSALTVDQTDMALYVTLYTGGSGADIFTLGSWSADPSFFAAIDSPTSKIAAYNGVVYVEDGYSLESISAEGRIAEWEPAGAISSVTVGSSGVRVIGAVFIAELDFSLNERLLLDISGSDPYGSVVLGLEAVASSYAAVGAFLGDIGRVKIAPWEPIAKGGYMSAEILSMIMRRISALEST